MASIIFINLVNQFFLSFVWFFSFFIFNEVLKALSFRDEITTEKCSLFMEGAAEWQICFVGSFTQLASILSSMRPWWLALFLGPLFAHSTKEEPCHIRGKLAISQLFCLVWPGLCRGFWECWSKTVKWVMSQIHTGHFKTYSGFSSPLPNTTSCCGKWNCQHGSGVFLGSASIGNLTSRDFF